MRILRDWKPLGEGDNRDLAIFNRWFCLTRLRVAATVAVFALGLHQLGISSVAPFPVVCITAGLAVVSAIGLWFHTLIERGRRFFLLQVVLDLAAITLGIGLATEGLTALLMRALYLLVIVPASLISVPIGLAAASFATIGHASLLGFERGISPGVLVSIELLAPAFLFFLVAQQSFFYGAHLARKNVALQRLTRELRASQRRLATEGRRSAELAGVGRALSASLDSPEPLAAVVTTIRGRLAADWAAIFVIQDDSFRLRAVTDEEVLSNDLAWIDFPLRSWMHLAALKVERALALDGMEVRRIPPVFLGGRKLGTVLLAALYREGKMAGLLAVGYQTPLGALREWSLQLLIGIAEHATIVLQNARLLEEVRVASELKSEFVGAVSHELRSPLNVILGYLEMMLDQGQDGLGKLSPDQMSALARTQRQGLMLLEMIAALLDLNRFEAGRMPIECNDVSVSELLGQVCEQVPESWRRAEVALKLEVDSHLPRIQTDQGKLKTVVRNLVHNALKFTERGHVTVSAALTPTGRVAITVTDSGRGIPAEAVPYIFDMFRQAPGSGGGGVGLGLHIVRRFVEALGGEVSVASSPGVGTCFTVTLPREAPGAKPAVGNIETARAA